MKKENFITLMIGTLGMVLFALGMCMCLIEEWNSFNQGIVMGIAGIAVLLITALIRRKMKGKPPITITKKALAIIALSVLGSLTLGVGMCMAMVWEGLLIWGIIVGLLGILILMCLIPLCIGLK